MKVRARDEETGSAGNGVLATNQQRRLVAELQHGSAFELYARVHVVCGVL